MKKLVATLLMGTMLLGAAACGNAGKDASGAVELEVVTTFAGNDGNAQNYKDAYAAWEKENRKHGS